jgi:hypothetical protein
MAAKVHTVILRVLTLYSLVDGCQYFGGTPQYEHMSWLMPEILIFKFSQHMLQVEDHAVRLIFYDVV